MEVKNDNQPEKCGEAKLTCVPAARPLLVMALVRAESSRGQSTGAAGLRSKAETHRRASASWA